MNVQNAPVPSGEVKYITASMIMSAPHSPAKRPGSCRRMSYVQRKFSVESGMYGMDGETPPVLL